MNLFITCFIILNCFKSTLAIKNNFSDIDKASLAKNFFESLAAKAQESEQSFHSFTLDVNRQILNYVEFLEGFHDQHTHRTKRSPDENDAIFSDNSGVYVLNKFMELNLDGVHLINPQNVLIFESTDKLSWYMAVLDSTNEFNSDLIIYKHVNTKYSEVVRKSFKGKLELGIYTSTKAIFVILAASKPVSSNSDEFLGIYKFHRNSLEKIQSFNSGNIKSFSFWEDHETVFMVVVSSRLIIYRWLGTHFKVHDFLLISNAQKAAPFKIGSTQFLAVANFNDTFGNTHTYSDIFKYDVDLKKFKRYQRILTEAAVDVKHFSFKTQHQEEHFVIFANQYERNADGTVEYETNSIVYKFFKDSFFPFQNFETKGASEWLSVQGSQGEFLLVLLTKFEHVKLFQYNGWRFIELEQSLKNLIPKLISKVDLYFEDGNLILTGLKKEEANKKSVFSLLLNFQIDYSVRDYYDEILKWGEEKLKDITELENKIKQITEKPENYTTSKRSSRQISLDQQDFFASHIDEDEIISLENTVEQLITDYSRMKLRADNSLHTGGSYLISGNVYVQELIVNGITKINFLTTEKLNNYDINDTYNRSINIYKSTSIPNGTLHFDTISIKNKNLNNLKHLLAKKSNQSTPAQLIVNGDVTFQNSLTVQGKIGGVIVNLNSVLLKSGNQSFDSFNLRTLKSGQVNIPIFETNIEIDEKNSFFEQISAKNVYLHGGLINSENVSNLNLYALKKQGIHNISAKYNFKSLKVKQVNIDSLNEYKMSTDFALTNKNETLNDTLFRNDVHVNNLKVTRNLNDIRVSDGKLEVLLVNSKNIQYVSQTKAFQNVNATRDIKTNGVNFDHHQLQKLATLRIVDQKIEVNDDCFINGELKIENLLDAADVSSNRSNNSIVRLLSKGLRLNATEIPVHLNLFQTIDVKMISADVINGIDINGLVLQGLDNEVKIRGLKQFSQNIKITGPTKLFNLNGIKTKGYENTVLKISGDQALVGRHHFKNVFANRIQNIKTDIGTNDWENVIMNSENVVIKEPTTIHQSLRVNSITTDRTRCNSLINGYVFDQLLKDSVPNNKPTLNFTDVSFINLTVKNLYANNEFLNTAFQMVEDLIFEIDETVHIYEQIAINNITFGKNLNEVSKDSFASRMSIINPNRTQPMNKQYEHLTVKGNLIIESNRINGIDLNSLISDVVKTDEYHHFHSVKFAKGVQAYDTVKLDGPFESLDLDDIIQQNSTTLQTIQNAMIFRQEVDVVGTINFRGLISGFNLSRFCDFSCNVIHDFTKTLHVNGNVAFKKCPEVMNVNGRLFKDLFENAWYTDRPMSINTENVEFEDVVFKKALTVEEHLQEIKFNLVAENYLSKTKNQTIWANYEIDDVYFSGNLRVKELEILGNLNNENFEEFLVTAVLNDTDQTFENTLFVDVCEIRNISGDYKVNQLNLENDVMRYDKENTVTGRKVLKNVNVNVLNMDEKSRFKIQNVDVLAWFQNIVLKSGTFKLPALTKFTDRLKITGELSVEGLVNGIKISPRHVMSSSFVQTITGRKIFTNENVSFKTIKVNGYINGINVFDLFSNVVYSNENELTFEGPVQMEGRLEATNINVRGLYDGVNLTLLINNLFQMNESSYVQMRKRLENAAMTVKRSFENRAYYLNGYGIPRIYKHVGWIEPTELEGDLCLAFVTKKTNGHSVSFEMWKNEAQNRKKRFLHPMEINSPNEFMYMKSIMYRGTLGWYIEQRISANPKKYEGGIYRLTESGNLIPVVRSISHPTESKSVTTFVLPDETKTNQLTQCLILQFEKRLLLYCESGTNEFGFTLKFYKLINNIGNKVSAQSISKIPFIFALNAITRKSVGDIWSVTVWKYHKTEIGFKKIQNIPVQSEKDFAVISINSESDPTAYLATFSRQSESSIECAGAWIVDIRKYNKKTDHFDNFQEIVVNEPLRLEFAELPSDALVLYVLTNNTKAQLLVYVYQGMSGFQKTNFEMEYVPFADTFNSIITSGNEHYVLIGSESKGWSVVAAKFKGQKFT